MLGQTDLRNHLIKLVNDGRFPHTLMLIADAGFGKRTLVRWLAETTFWDLYEVPGNKVDDVRAVIEDSATLSMERIYLFADAHNMTPAAQNALLKLAEEPPQNAYIILTTTSWNAILPTIRSRATQQSLAQYGKGELETLTKDPEVLSIARCPGMIERMQDPDVRATLDHCYKIADSIGKVTVANTFNILKHVKPENYEFILPFLRHIYGKELQKAETREATRKVNDCIQVVYAWKLQLERSPSSNLERALEQMFIELREVATDG